MRRPNLALALSVVLTLGACGGKAKLESLAPQDGSDRGAAPARPASGDAGRAAADRAEGERAAVLAEAIYFGYDEVALRPASRATLEAKAVVLRADGNTRVVISGHADERGSDEYNLALGMRRANAAKRYLVQMGIAAGRVDVVSHGEERPAKSGHDEQAYAANRRDEFSVSGTAISQQ